MVINFEYRIACLFYLYGRSETALSSFPSSANETHIWVDILATLGELCGL